MSLFQPEGPYDIGGYSLGAVLAYEVVRQLQALGEIVNSLVMIDPVDPCIAQQILDTEDESELAINFLILREVNFTLASINSKDRKQSLIHRDDIKIRGNPNIFLHGLLSIAKTRGLKMTEQRLRSRVATAHAVLKRCRLYAYKINLLPKPDEVSGYLFLNGSRRFYGSFEPYCFLQERTGPDGECDYWQEWQKACDSFSTTYLNSSTHLMMVLEPESMDSCFSICEELYGEEFGDRGQQYG